MSRYPRLDALLAIAFSIIIPAIAVYQQKPPEVVPKTAPLTEFSAERAMVHVEKIADKPHPHDTEESAKVQTYLMDELKTLGITPELITSPTYPGTSIVAVLPGTVGALKGLLLCAHYDSRPEGPGAGDDAAGVAAILETVRALKMGPPLVNDLIILFTDAEEWGLCGARAFVESGPRRMRVGLVLNFEGRGSRGPSYMFETSERNGWMIRQFANASPYPIGTSLTAAVYRKMPNSTDLTVFKGSGLKGLNFAFVDGYENYHQPTDTPANLDQRSLQHHGSYALALTKRFGQLDLNRADLEPDAVYFHVMGPHLIVYPEKYAVPLMFVAAALYGLVMMFGIKRNRVSERGVMIGVAVGLVMVFLATIAAYLAWTAIRMVQPMGVKGRGTPEIAVGLTLLGLTVSLLISWWMLRKTPLGDLTMGGLFWWLLLAAYTALGLPGGSYVFLWPLLFGLVGMMVRVLARDETGTFVKVVDYIAALPLLLILPPTLQSLCAGLGPSDPVLPAPVAGLLVLGAVPMIAKVFVKPIVKPLSLPH